MERLTARLREFLRLESDDLPFSWEEVEARDYLRAVVTDAAGDFAARGLTLTLLPSQSRARIRIDRMEFARVLYNLFENSVKYRRGETAEVRVSVAEDPARANVAAGSGLGLAVVRQIIMASGGTVGAAASPLGGLRIHIAMPIVGKEKDQGDLG